MKTEIYDLPELVVGLLLRKPVFCVDPFSTLRIRAWQPGEDPLGDVEYVYVSYEAHPEPRL